MNGELTEMESRCVEIVAKHLRGPLAVKIVREIIREMRIPTPEMISAMGSALWNSGLKRGGHVTPTLKHQLRWAAAIDKASPERK